MADENRVKTRFLIVSDTHGREFPSNLKPLDAVDVALHCDDLTDESKIHEFKSTLQLLKDINAPLKLVIAGNHDFTLDIPMFKKTIHEATQRDPTIDDTLVKKEFGDFGEARQLFEDAKESGIIFLDEGTHQFNLSNGASLTIYASPFTKSESTTDWGFVYSPREGHQWNIGERVDVVLTHSPPLGIFDYVRSRPRAGSSSLFEAIARSKPLLHCFGHVHSGWGAKLATWRETISDSPSHFKDIDNDKSTIIETLGALNPGKFDPEDLKEKKEEKLRRYRVQRCCLTSHCHDDVQPLQSGAQTLFLNASITDPEEDNLQLPWLVHLELPRAVVEKCAKDGRVIED